MELPELKPVPIGDPDVFKAKILATRPQRRAQNLYMIISFYFNEFLAVGILGYKHISFEVYGEIFLSHIMYIGTISYKVDTNVHWKCLANVCWNHPTSRLF